MSDSSKRRWIQLAALLLFAAPLLAFWAYSLLVQPAPNYEGIDPEYEYLLNSLAAFKHQPYVYVDHPGTPVEMFGTAILGATYPWLAGRPEGFTGFYVRNPQVFLTLAYVFLILVHAACILAVFRIATRTGEALNAWTSAAVAMMYFAIQPYSFSASLLWSHNSFSFPLGTLLLLGLYAGLHRDENRGERSPWIWLGLGVGVGVLAAITIFLASWVVGFVSALLLYYGLERSRWRSGAAALAGFTAGAVTGFYLSVLPVISRMGGFWTWIYSILSHQSNYLAVPQDQPMVERLSTNTRQLFELLPALSVTMLVTLVLGGAGLIFWRKQIRNRAADYALFLGLSAQMIALTVIFLDRPLRAYYFLGVAAILPVLAMIVLKLYQPAASAHRVLSSAVSLVVLLGIFFNAVQAIGAWRGQVKTQADSRGIVQQVLEDRARQAGKAVSNLTILWMYGTYSECWGLWFADQRAGDAFIQEISGFCPHQYELTGRVLLPSGKAALDSVDWDVVFTCDRYVDDVLSKDPSAIVQHFPSVEWTCGKMAVILNK